MRGNNSWLPPQGLPDVRADVGQRLIGEQVSRGGGSGGARRCKVRMGVAERCPGFVRGGGHQPLKLLDRRLDAGFLALELPNRARRIASQVGSERLKPSFFFRCHSRELLDGFLLRLARQTGDQLADGRVRLAFGLR